MIRVILLGRTGNQLFQYALGRVLSEKHGVPLVLDGSCFNREGWRGVSYFLKLPLKAKVVRRLDLGTRVLRKITGKRPFGLMRPASSWINPDRGAVGRLNQPEVPMLVASHWEYRGKTVLREKINDHFFDPQFLSAPKDCVLLGYFQTPLYFKSISHELRSELNRMFSNEIFGITPQSAAHSVGARLRENLLDSNSVAVHVRRQDYLYYPGFQVCDSTYYKRAFEKLRDSVPGARFWIFSDDPNWCRGEFRGADKEVVDSGRDGKNPLHDLHLMSLAAHHIIANSTYSWWAAWLGNKPSQQVIVPTRWFAHSIQAPIHEKCLPHWQIIAQ